MNLPRICTGIILALALLGATPTAAAAHPARPESGASAAAACTAVANKPWRDSNTAVAWISTSGCAGEPMIGILERHLWSGWERVTVAEWDGNIATYLPYHCAGEGTYTYRASVVRYSVILARSPEGRFTC